MSQPLRLPGTPQKRSLAGGPGRRSATETRLERPQVANVEAELGYMQGLRDPRGRDPRGEGRGATVVAGVSERSL